MQTFDYILLDVFTETLLSRNPLAVFPDAGVLAPERMQRVAAKLNLFEDVFVTRRNPFLSRQHGERVMNVEY